MSHVRQTATRLNKWAHIIPPSSSSIAHKLNTVGVTSWSGDDIWRHYVNRCSSGVARLVYTVLDPVLSNRIIRYSPGLSKCRWRFHRGRLFEHEMWIGTLRMNSSQVYYDHMTLESRHKFTCTRPAKQVFSPGESVLQHYLAGVTRVRWRNVCRQYCKWLYMYM